MARNRPLRGPASPSCIGGDGEEVMHKRLSLGASASIVTQLQFYTKGQTHWRGICASVSGSEPAKRDTLAGGCAIAVRTILHAWNSWNLTIEPQSLERLRTSYKTWNRAPEY